ncbi:MULTISPECIES: ATP-binding protein [unclassified Pseudoclavibacter]|uniref:ATP-binding protein n=1 Tax=unclassified Pseudoclavibacter TaxID=2615177 RepID=UPI000CE8FE4B|nr:MULTISPECIES: ATP-binding protein [unclassified Pseudoclavibacter]PPF35279.1 AAA family ATPase [Pseudoclavibacter sp. AY1H1]PPF78062.1 AAA family ATPase [Pseudoclavibacter sp. Z016]
MSEQSHDDVQFFRAFKRFLERVNETPAEVQVVRTPFGGELSDFLGADAEALPVVVEEFASYRIVDADIALEEIAARGEARLVGVAGGSAHAHAGLAELISSPHMPFRSGPAEFAEKATGPRSTRQVVSFGARLFTYRGARVVVMQRASRPDMGRPQGQLEVLTAADPSLVSDLLGEVRALMIERSVLRGKVLAFENSDYRMDAGASFLERPNVAETDVILPYGVLESVVAHVIEIGRQREVLLAAGQHLKRGVLLYGPPGTGKTLTVRHLLSRTEGVTAVLLTGSSIQHIGAAAELARTLQPSIVVLEDIDLVAMERHASPQPLLFEVLDALDGLDGDADVAFIMTTNRVQVLERALVSRPGRVDLAVEIALPGGPERYRLLEKYAAGLPFSDEALLEASGRAEQTTGSFAKELIRRAVLAAARHGVEPDDEILLFELDELMSAQSALTRRLLGDGTEPSGDEATEGGVEIISTAEGDRTGSVTYGALGAEADPGWTAYVPASDAVYPPGVPGAPPEPGVGSAGEANGSGPVHQADQR